MNFVRSAFQDADLLLYVVEPDREQLKDEALYERLRRSKLPLIVVINKIDTINSARLKEYAAYWHGNSPGLR